MVDGEQVAPQHAPPTGGEKMSRYTVQRAVRVGDDASGEQVRDPYGVEPGEEALWEDIGVVEVPVRSHRKSAVTKALEAFDIPEDSHPSFFRALEQEIAEPIPVTVEQPPAPPARLKVGR